MVEGPMSTAGGGKHGGGSAGVIIGVVVLLGAAGGILYWVNKRDAGPAGASSATPSAPASTMAAPETTLDLPPIDIPDTGPEVGPPDAGAKIQGGGGSACACSSFGAMTPEIGQAVAARGGTAKQCYKTALEGNEGLAGEIVMQVRVGPNGETCSVQVLSDTVGSSKLQQCARSKMSASYPRPKGGCVDVKVPVVFKPK